MLKAAQALVFPKNETWERKRASMGCAQNQIQHFVLANAFCYVKLSKILVEPVKFLIFCCQNVDVLLPKWVLFPVVAILSSSYLETPAKVLNSFCFTLMKRS